MKAAVYLRVSSRDGRQDEANQEPACLELCRARGWEPVVFRERESGVKARPVWREVLELGRRGQVGAVVVWALDRIGRKPEEVAKDLADLLRWRVDVVSVRDPWLDQGGPMRDLLIAFMTWLGKWERERMIERTHAGLARARAKGTRLGRPPSIPTAVLARVLELRAVGLGWRAVARNVDVAGLGKWSRAGLEKALARWQQNGVLAAAPNPGPHAGLADGPTRPTN